MLVGWEVPNVDELTSPFPPNKSVQGDDLDTLLGQPAGRGGRVQQLEESRRGPVRERPRSNVDCIKSRSATTA